MEVQIRANHFKSSSSLNSYIEEKVLKLESLYHKVISVDVSLKLENSGQVKDKIVEARLDVPGNMIISKAVSKTFESAVDQCIKKLKRNLIRLKTKR